MDDFNVNLVIEDIFCCEGCKNTIIREVLVTSVNQTIILQDDFVLNIVAVNDTFFTVLIQNGFEVIIRNIYTTFPTQICLPNKCCKHLLKISGTIINLLN